MLLGYPRELGWSDRPVGSESCESCGKFAGEQLDLNETTLFEKRDLPVLNDYRSVLSHTLSRMYGLNTAEVEKVFPGSLVRDYGIL